jgi:hypothetical protein
MSQSDFVSIEQNDLPVIYASDIGQFLYCHRAWWYRLQGEENSELARLRQGADQHEALAETVQEVERVARGARVLVWVVVLLILVFVAARLLSGG